ncbi:MAG: Stk1 family PASTA domain-containing Ser/Thr kinase [Clostridia bacterium]|nr:Stk1 family PASTA domain-containing Ser/Thr kinase [Clostridia bacterium]
MDRFVGKRLDGRYEIREILGIGGMAVVYKAYDNVENRIVAIKILRKEYATNEEFLRRFKNESKAISLLSHPNIVKIYDVSFGDLIQYIVMEYIEGITLKEFIEREGSLSWKDAVYYTIQILRGLQHAHDRGIVHRDVKPQNIMLLPDGTIKVTDFGIARFARSEQKTITDKAIGSVHYISPEQARGETTDERTDIYSVGVILYEMLTGRLPFQADNAVSVAIMQLQREPQLPTEINGSIPLGAEQITMHAMQKNTVNRYKSSSEMLCDLEKFKKDPAITFDFTYFVDDSPTKFIDTEEAANDSEETAKSPVIPILAGVAVTFVVAIIALLAFFLPNLFRKTSEINCPKFIGMTYQQVEADEYLQSTFNISYEWVSNAEYEKGVVYDQSIPENRPIKNGATIMLYVSNGKVQKKIPDIKGETELNAKKILESVHGFKVVIEPKEDDKLDAGLAIGTSPVAGSDAPEGSEIILYISSGAPTVNVDLPNLVGMSEKDAKDKLQKAGLTIGNITEVDNKPGETVPKGFVVSQTPNYEKNKQVKKGTQVDLQISSGNTAYSADVSVEIPDNVTAVSLWVDGSMVKEVASITAGQKTVVFKGVTAKAQSVNAEIRVKTPEWADEYMVYQKIQIDLSTGNYTVITG